MDLKTRRIIYISFITLFLILAPLTIFYTAGYRYDFKRHKILKTGGIFLYVKNPDVKIFVNDTLKEETNFWKKEIRINNLLPNSYNIKVEKDGYFPWTKNLEVQSGQTTFAEHIILFKQSVPEILAEGRAEIINFSPDEKFLSYAVNNEGTMEVWIKNLATGEDILVYRSAIDALKKNNESLSWSADNQKIILTLLEKSQPKYLLININNPTATITVDKFTDIDFQKLVWSPFNSELIYGLGDNAIYRINLFDKSSQKITDGEDVRLAMSDFVIKNNQFYYTENDANNSYLSKKPLSGGTAEKLLQLEKNNYELIPGGPNNILAILNTNKSEISLVNLSDLSLIIKGSGDEGVWSANNERLLYFNDFELWSYDIEDDNPILITRYGQKIKSARWVPGFDYVGFLLGNSLKIIELDGRDGRNLYDIASNTETDSFIFESRGEYIYFVGIVDGQPGLYKLSIK